MKEFDYLAPIIEAEEDKKEKKSERSSYKKHKKELLVFFIAIIVISICFFFIISPIKKDKDKVNISFLKTDYLGKIYCIYILENDQIESNLFGKNFEIPNTIEIYVDNSKINNIKEYKLKGKKSIV